MIGKDKLQTDAVNKPDLRKKRKKKQSRNLHLIRWHAGSFLERRFKQESFLSRMRDCFFYSPIQDITLIPRAIAIVFPSFSQNLPNLLPLAWDVMRAQLRNMRLIKRRSDAVYPIIKRRISKDSIRLPKRISERRRVR